MCDSLVLISTYWNVNVDWSTNYSNYYEVLISTYWNVNLVVITKHSVADEF